MRTVLRTFSSILLGLLVTGALLGAFWLGLVPQRFSPFSPVEIDRPPGWFLDTKLAALRRDAPLCRSVLKAPAIYSTPVDDSPYKNGCGWLNAVRVTKSGGAQLTVEPLTCEMAAAVTMWISTEVQPSAERHFGSRVRAITDFGTYDCRKMIGNPLFAHRMSQHASANALDISAFTLENGQRVDIARHWSGTGPEARFLRDIHARSCRYFRVALGPDYNAAHKDHFHFDRGLGWVCR